MSEVQSSSVPLLRWLHLTDLHVGKSNESQKTALESLINAVKAECGNTTFDLVMLTGDLAYSGSAAEYEKIEDLIINPLKELENFKDAKFVATPGNHDLDCDVGHPINWSSLGQKRQATFFNLDEQGRKTRAPRAAAFKCYSSFLQKNGILGVDPVLDPAKIERIEVRGNEIALLTVVSAFFSDKDVTDYQISQAPVHPIRTLLNNLKEPVQTIVLSHHPITWFSPESEKQLWSVLLENNILYINGHEHRVTTRFGNKGVVLVGFGASYQDRLESQKSEYKNSFAICELNQSLHTKIVSWNSEHGKWRTDVNLPPEFADTSDYLHGGFRLDMPSTKVSTAQRPYASLAASVRPHIQLEKCIWLATDGTKRWIKLLLETSRFREVKEHYNLRSQQLAAGHHEFRIVDHRGNHLVYVVSGFGDIFTYDQLQSINTELDTQDYADCIVATLGTLSDDATTLANKLKAKKPITVLERDVIIRDLIRYGPSAFNEFINQQDAAHVKLAMVITNDGLALLRQERVSGAWFDVVNERGDIVPEFDPIIFQLRKELPEFQNLRYRSLDPNLPAAAAENATKETFDLKTYLSQTHAYFDDVRYAPLAALGLRFRATSLSEIYVSANADVSGNGKNAQSINRAVDEFVDALSLPKAQKDQLESQLRRTFGADPSNEVGAARQLYQRFNNVVVLGDPGSGKTCFVKYEILAYCKPPNEGGSWYSNHLPVYVSLAEASRLINDSTSLLDICEILSSRRGIPLPKVEILRALSDGRAAMFFDGLDEVGFIEKRLKLMDEIESLYQTQAKRGNRFVLASRPAAVQPVEIPNGMTYLHLKGLSESEMRVLAGRVLTSRLGELEGGKLTDDESALVERLLEDTKHSPGIARIARNPLLLTLLVLIYANTGAAVSAKRHLIYTQAIKTLVSVRGRETREQQISEADLRTRLGALAVAVFSRDIAEIPQRSEVIRVLNPLVSDNASDDSATNAFLQEVAEATGLLVIHSEGENRNRDLITFMHYSFLEYYAAAGLLSLQFLQKLPDLASNPRWKDVVTLLFGVLSEHGDVTPALEALLNSESSTHQITKSRLLLALDCAAECDVPPIATQQLLAKSVADTMSNGVGKKSESMRESLAEKLGYFLQGASAKFDAVIVEGLSSPDNLTAAAYANLLAHVSLDVTLSDQIVRQFSTLIERTDAVTTTAVMFAVERRDELRLEMVVPSIVRALKGSLAEKHAALKLLSAVPAYYARCTGDVTNLLDDPNDFISSNAAQCVLANTESIGTLSESNTLVEKLLTKLTLLGDDAQIILPGVTLDRQQVRSMITNGSKGAGELAIRYISLVRDDPQFIYQTLFHTLRTTDEARHKAACLDSLQTSPRAIDLITIAETDFICGLLAAPERNVRLAAIRLLGEMPDDEQVIRSLQELLHELAEQKGRDLEIAEIARALSKHTSRSQILKEDLIKLLSDYLPSSGGFGDNSKQQHLAGLLTICESLDSESGKGIAHKLLTLAEDFKTPENLRKHALKAYGKVCEPTRTSIDNLIRLLGRNDIKLSEALFDACLSYIRQCRRKVEFVRRVYPRLGEFRDRLHTAWLRETAGTTESIDLSGARDIRDALIGIEDLMAQYGEFAERAQLNGTASG